MDIDQAFPTKYVAAQDLKGRDTVLTIRSVAIEDIGTNNPEQKPVVYFDGAQKGLVLNKTNAHRIKELWGSETGNWIGQKITLYPSETDFQGKTVPCIRIRGEVTPVVQSEAPPAPFESSYLKRLTR